ncbi:hypothetical protein Q5H92_08560 [Hymenobacter sp. M29]|uniref:DUF4221 domain-containing protein n=1 Tax=Hymenobacter mellowenesis TaxID=3063995 RepID=A0ABT9A983_9BACT|nr:hypothetical protein [Hymenobacter sp. M29]MDO7846405.1 hypothetical protein [Hymenobacter sp. M29]
MRYPHASAAPLLAAILLLSSCKKETEIIVEKEVVKQSSWSEVPSLYGLARVILSTGSNGQSIYLQQPRAFTRFNSQAGLKGLVTTAGPFPADVEARLPIGRDIFAYPDMDSLLTIVRNNDILTSQFYVSLRRFDPAATRFNTRLFSLSKCMAINRNNYLLAPYENTRPDRAYTFLLAAVTPGSAGTPLTASTRKVVIPKLPFVGGYLRNLEAIDDYFLVNLGSDGIFKIKQDGSFRQVYASALADAFYKWNNTVYAPLEYNEMLTSTDNGDTWTRSTGVPLQFALASYYTVRDSLVFTHAGGLYTLRWNGPRYTMRPLKNDGLERATITGIEYLRDTVYVATTSGLFARPVKTFFEKQQ